MADVFSRRFAAFVHIYLHVSRLSRVHLERISLYYIRSRRVPDSHENSQAFGQITCNSTGSTKSPFLFPSVRSCFYIYRTYQMHEKILLCQRRLCYSYVDALVEYNNYLTLDRPVSIFSIIVFDYGTISAEYSSKFHGNRGQGGLPGTRSELSLLNVSKSLS